MGTGIRKRNNPQYEYKYQNNTQQEIKSYCLYCDSSIYVKNTPYCNTFCHYAYSHGTHKALIMWCNS